ncbi:MAG: transglutaminase domain-containing protein [Prevotella sp.]|nr:transglutaminase domain-containing protein [Prevotella sp.]MCM1075296.1 transglutaminase domain-containing protein [Ruminococcus sp.]
MIRIKKLLFTISCACLALGVFASSPEERIVSIGQYVYKLPKPEADALEFMYNSMPMSDKLMYPAEYHLTNTRLAIKAREEMPWGKTVPHDLWQHFVLPARANNEYLDNFRATYYDELKERVKGLTMEQAALEVNHWLHEKVTYHPSDIRTSAPMATILNSKGRCGEESVVGVAAFRTVGIPARQVYTPRWAHTDDNHAWVEVWVDGKWHFLGACEPEPELDRAWFNAPASRGLLMHTKVFGNYPGPEQIISQSKGITEINVTDNYVPVRKSKVTVVDINGQPVKNIKVDYKIYNYAEFFTAASRITDNNGTAMLKTGCGDMLAWASNGTYFGFAKVAGEDTRLVLNHKIGEVFSMDIDIVPPVENPIPSKATEADIAENALRFEYENTLRNAYTQTFYGEKHCPLPKAEVNLLFKDNAERVDAVLRKAKGNWKAIYDFLTVVPQERLSEALDMLDVVSDKDLRDTPSQIFLATLIGTAPQYDNPLYVEYILNPRIANELLTDYRRTIHPAKATSESQPVNKLIKQASEIEIDNEANAYRVPVTPTEVWKSRKADSHSRDIFFVALCRNNSIPARIDAITGACQYHDGNVWVTVKFDEQETATSVLPEGRLSASFSPSEYLTDPEYFRHFTISNMDSGLPSLLEYGDDINESYSTLLKNGLTLPEGYYLLTTGVRQASGAVSAHLSFFNINRNQTTTETLIMRHNPESIEVIGNIDAETLYLPEGGKVQTSILSTTGRGYFILGVLGDTDEPSNHAAAELAGIKNALQNWDRPIVIIGKKRDNLADNPLIKWGSDPEGKVQNMIEALIPENSTPARLPMFVLADSFGRVVFLSSGYDTSLGQKLLRMFPEL